MKATPSRPRPTSQAAPPGGQDGHDQGQRPLAGGGLGPDGEAGHRGRRHRGEHAPHPQGPLAELAFGLEGEEAGPVDRQSSTTVTPGEQGVAVEQVGEGPGVLLVGADRHPVQQVAQRHADEQGREQAPAGGGQEPRPPPAGAVALAAELERHPAGDQGHQQQQEGQVERRRTWSRTSRGRRRRSRPRRRSARPRCRPRPARWSGWPARDPARRGRPRRGACRPRSRSPPGPGTRSRTRPGRRTRT